MMIISDRTRGLLLSLLAAISLSACGGSSPGGAAEASLSADPNPTPGGPLVANPPTNPVTLTNPGTPSLVTPPANPTGTTANQAPTITGAPVTSSQTGRPYAFKPTAADVNGDGLTFSIAGKPKWADFDVLTGVLSGTPLEGSAGAYPGISISVSDGKLKATLAPFSIAVSTAATKTVTVLWTAPSTNEDGSALTDLAGYVISYGKTSHAYTTTLDIVGAGETSVVVEGFEPGTWYFAMQAVNVPGERSDYSNEVVAVL